MDDPDLTAAVKLAVEQAAKPLCGSHFSIMLKIRCMLGQGHEGNHYYAHFETMVSWPQREPVRSFGPIGG